MLWACLGQQADGMTRSTLPSSSFGSEGFSPTPRRAAGYPLSKATRRDLQNAEARDLNLQLFTERDPDMEAKGIEILRGWERIGDWLWQIEFAFHAALRLALRPPD